jgi:CPA1 family monovalent cation:H+ antiporter
LALFELLILLLFAGGVFALWSDRLGVPYPALLALIGALIALVPGGPGLTLNPDLALALFVAPTLLDAAYDASPRDLRRNLFAVAGLAVALVLVTVMAVAWAARWAVPGLGWAPAFALGAIVAPPDASAAAAVLRKLGLPHRLMVILEGESLFNDATALILYRVAVGAAATGAFSPWRIAPLLLLACGGGVAAGWALARLQVRLSAHVRDIPINVLFQFIGTFAVWIIAERLGLSPILAMVAFAMTLARRMGGRAEARSRIASYAVWDVAVLVLNVLAFLLIGLQLRGVLARLGAGDLRIYALCAGAVCATVILVRIAWGLAYAASIRWKRRAFGPADPERMPTYANAALASWCGMRGIVTLAAALALPDGPSGFPHRDLIVFSAFCVVLATLVLQGLTLGQLIRRLGLHEDGSVDGEIALARAETARAALRSLDGKEGAPADLLRGEYLARLRAGGSGREKPDLPGLQRQAARAQRESLRDLRARDRIGDDAFHVVEEEIDLLDLTADARVPPARGNTAGSLPGG